MLGQTLNLWLSFLFVVLTVTDVTGDSGIKKEEQLENVNSKVLEAINTDTAIVVVQRTQMELESAENEGGDVAKKAEVDEMQSFVGKKEEQRWLWHAIDHCTAEILAYLLEA